MATNEERPQRKSPRADWLGYNEGRYFVTVCTRDHRHCFGKIENGVMTMTTVGRYLDEELKNATSHQPYIRVLQHVVMPNHFHAIVEVDSGDANVVGTRHGVSAENRNKNITDAPWRVPTTDERMNDGIKIKRLPLLSTYICSLKAAVTRYAHANGIPFAWQPRYHDHAIRDWKDNNNISQYIENNVMNWEKDCLY